MSKPLLHFAHANGFPAGSYKGLFTALEERFRVTAVPQFGHDPHYPVEDNWQALVEELIWHLTQVDQGPAIGVGHSFGGVITYMAACQAPWLFKGVILLDPPLVAGPVAPMVRLAKRTALIDRITPAGVTRYRARRWPKGKDLVAYFRKKALFAGMSDESIGDYVQAAVCQEDPDYQRLRFKPEVECRIFRTVPTNLGRYAGKLRCPSMLVTVKGSEACKPVCYRPFLRQNPVMQHKQIEGLGHLFPLQAPQAAAEMIIDIVGAW